MAVRWRKGGSHQGSERRREPDPGPDLALGIAAARRVNIPATIAAYPAAAASRAAPLATFDALKRGGDLVVSLVALLALSPVLLVISILIAVRLGRPIIFRQPRAGRYGHPFNIWKFRTMRDICGEDGQPLPEDERLTPLGRFLRSTSLDELPELFNVVRGEMSLVGPRPLLLRYLPRYSAEQARRHDVRPGITGWAQVNGRTALSWERRFALDVWYVDHHSIRLDLRILALTVTKTIAREGISGPGHWEEFRGN